MKYRWNITLENNIDFSKHGKDLVEIFGFKPTLSTITDDTITIQNPFRAYASGPKKYGLSRIILIQDRTKNKLTIEFRLYNAYIISVFVLVVGLILKMELTGILIFTLTPLAITLGGAILEIELFKKETVEKIKKLAPTLSRIA